MLTELFSTEYFKTGWNYYKKFEISTLNYMPCKSEQWSKLKLSIIYVATVIKYVVFMDLEALQCQKWL